MIETLTPKETEVLSLISLGLSNKEIAEKMRISGTTVRTHLKNIYFKFSSSGTTETSTTRLKAALVYLKETGRLKQ